MERKLQATLQYFVHILVGYLYEIVYTKILESLCILCVYFVNQHITRIHMNCIMK